MKTLTNKLIIYDSNCKVCSSLRDVVLRFTNIPTKKIVAYKDLSVQQNAMVDHAMFKNGMALIDTTGAATLYGAEGVAWIFSSQYRIIDFLLRFRLFYLLFAFLYKTQAHNRYIMATPKSKFQCDCVPDKVIKYRLTYIVIGLTISVILTMLFGISLTGFFANISPGEAALQMLLMAGTGWVIQMILAVVFLKGKALDYIGHLVTIMVAGLLVLVPWMLFHAATGILSVSIPVASVVLSSIVMLWLHISRASYLELNHRWTASWFLLLQCTAFFWVWFFHLNNVGL